MARPLKFYIILNHGRAEPVVYHGSADAKIRVATLRAMQYSAALMSFRTQLAAEEFASWFNYEREKKEGAA